jgi:putative hydrolase of the HAD superfamily
MTSVLALDVDGVVVTGHRDGGPWDRDVERLFGVAPQALQEHFFKPHWPAIITGEKDMMLVLEQVWRGFGGTATAGDFIAHWFAADSTIDGDVITLVETWRAGGGKAVLATNQEPYRARHLWNEMGLSRYFDDMLYSADLKAQKPDTAFFRRAQERLQAPAAQVIFADDRAENVAAASEFGWRAIHYRTIADLQAVL